VKLFFQLFLFISILAYSNKANSQDIIIKRSNNKVSLNGIPYYIHIVKKGETLWAISQAYEVPKDTIKKDNLHVSDELKSNQYLKIRITPQEQSKQEFVYHRVVKGDTPYNLAIRYNTTISLIYKYNPDAKISISLGEVLKIPLTVPIELKETDSLPKNKEIKHDFIVHIVKKKETLSGIAAIYGSSQEQIKKKNKALNDRAIEVGEKILIPVIIENIPKNENYYFHIVKKEETLFRITQLYQLKYKQLYKINADLKDRILQEGELVKIPKTEFTDSVFNIKIPTDTVFIEPEKNMYALWQDSLILPPCPIKDIDTLTSYKVAFFLPFFLNINDSLGKYVDVITRDENGVEILETVAREGKIEDKIYTRSKLFIDFYQGALLALQNLKQLGVSLEVHVFDTQRDSNLVKEILKSSDLSDFDLFIGPMYGEILELVGDYAWEHQINIVSPLSLKNDFIEHNPYAFQVSPPFDVQMHHASDYLNNFDIKNYIVIHDGNNQDQQYISKFKTQLYAQMTEDNFDQIRYHEIFYYDARDSVLKNSFTQGIQNIVIVPSSNRAFVTDVIGKLNGYSYEYDITVFGQPRWLSFENIELDNFHNTNTHLFSNSFIDYSKPEVLEFIRQYRLFFKGEPDKYAFQGYDITNYFCLALNKYGKDFRKCIHMHEVNMLQTKFRFVPYSDQGGYQNTAIYILEYTKNYKLHKVAEFPEK